VRAVRLARRKVYIPQPAHSFIPVGSRNPQNNNKVTRWQRGSLHSHLAGNHFHTCDPSENARRHKPGESSATQGFAIVCASLPLSRLPVPPPIQYVSRPCTRHPVISPLVIRNKSNQIAVDLIVPDSGINHDDPTPTSAISSAN